MPGFGVLLKPTGQWPTVVPWFAGPKDYERGGACQQNQKAAHEELLSGGGWPLVCYFGTGSHPSHRLYASQF
jgi:hypothetical protein